MSRRAAPARRAMAIPSPVATGGFVVSANTCPAPPVASSVARARTSVRRPSSTRNRHPTTRPAAITRSVEQAKERISISSVRLVLSRSARTISQPVASPRACSTRLRECAASRVKWKRPSSRSKRAPQDASSRMRSGPSSTSTRAAGADTMPAPAPRVSSRCRSGPSSTAQGDRHSALRVAGVALRGLVLRHHEHPAVAGQAQGRAQAGDAGARARGSRFRFFN